MWINWSKEEVFGDPDDLQHQRVMRVDDFGCKGEKEARDDFSHGYGWIWGVHTWWKELKANEPVEAAAAAATAAQREEKVLADGWGQGGEIRERKVSVSPR